MGGVQEQGEVGFGEPFALVLAAAAFVHPVDQLRPLNHTWSAARAGDGDARPIRHSRPALIIAVPGRPAGVRC